MKSNKFSESLKKFTEALEFNIETPKNSIYLSNRALIHIKLENYGLAVEGKHFFFKGRFFQSYKDRP